MRLGYSMASLVNDLKIGTPLRPVLLREACRKRPRNRVTEWNFCEMASCLHLIEVGCTGKVVQRRG